jgi:outer membrane receptor protein involved in Fe transport
VEAALFSRWIDNTILFAPVSSFLVRADNYPRARARGVEGTVDLRPGVGLRLQGSYTFTETRFGEPAMSLPGHPPHRVAARLGWRYPFEGRGAWGLGLWTGATFESAQVLSRFDSTEEEGRVLLSAGASFSWRWLTLSAEGRNLLDKRDALDTVGFPIAPARFMVSAALSL